MKSSLGRTILLSILVCILLILPVAGTVGNITYLDITLTAPNVPSTDLAGYNANSTITNATVIQTGYPSYQWEAFTDYARTNPIPIYFETYDVTNHIMKIWFKLPQMVSGVSQRIYLLQNISRTTKSDYSTGWATFPWGFDDWKETSPGLKPNATAWNLTYRSSIATLKNISIINGALELNASTKIDYAYALQFRNTFTPGNYTLYINGTMSVNPPPFPHGYASHALGITNSTDANTVYIQTGSSVHLIVWGSYTGTKELPYWYLYKAQPTGSGDSWYPYGGTVASIILSYNTTHHDYFDFMNVFGIGTHFTITGTDSYQPIYPPYRLSIYGGVNGAAAYGPYNLSLKPIWVANKDPYRVSEFFTDFKGFADYTTAPVASYTYPQSTGTINWNLVLTDTSTNSPTSWYWELANSTGHQISTVKNPIFNMSFADSYILNMTATSGVGSGSSNNTVILAKNPTPAARFVQTDTNWTNNTGSLAFHDSSAGTNVTGWYYQTINNDHGNTSTSQNPVLTFPCNAGDVFGASDYCLYDLNHQVNDSGYFDGTPSALWNVSSLMWNQSNWVTVYQNRSPLASFTADKTTGTTPYHIQFTATQVGTIKIDSWQWDFGNGTTSTLQNPLITTNSAGQYSVTLNAWNYTLGNFTQTKQGYFLVQNPAPAARFSQTALNWTNTTTSLPQTDASTGTNVNWWYWDWQNGDRSYNASLSQNPSPRFPCNAGEVSGSSDYCLFDQNLIVNDSYDQPWNVSSTWWNQSNWVTVYQNSSPSVSFTGTPLSGERPIAVQFNATPAGTIEVDSWAWDFGDGNTSSVQNASNTFSDAGQYLVTLTATNYTLGQAVISKTNYVTVSNPEPVVAWSNAPAYTNATTAIQFTDGSIGTNLTADSHSWDFNDGNTSTLQNPTHAFPCNTGEICTYTINKSTTDSPGSPWAVTSWLNRTDWVIIYANLTPTISFTEDITAGTVPFTVMFNGTSYGIIGIDSWAWDFGDTGTASGQNATHDYTQAGLYSISLTAVNFTLGEAVNVKTDLILAKNPKPTAIANFTPALVNRTTDVYFVDSSTGTNITAWTWDFQDGNTSAAKNPTNRFPDLGSYTVIHSVTDSSGTPWEIVSDNEYIVVKVVNNSISGDFVGVPTTGTIPFWTHFTWTGTGGPEENYTWDFGDGNTSTAGSDTWHLYEVSGTFWVNISVGNDAGYYFVNKTNYITANPHGGGGGGPKPTADFSGVPLAGGVPLNVAFTDLSDCYSCLVWSWDFGDTGSSGLPNPSHTYTSPGIYPVQLMVVNASGSDTKTVLNYITVGQFTVDFTANVTSSSAPPLTVQFTATPTVDHVIDDWYWEFGDGNLDIVQNPLNTYITFGSFSVNLRIRNVTDTLEFWQNKTNYIVVLNPNQTLLTWDSGETWISWKWDNQVINSYAGGALYSDSKFLMNLSGNLTEEQLPSKYIQTGLNPAESHSLAIYAGIHINDTCCEGVVLSEKVGYTQPPLVLNLILFLISTVLLGLTFALETGQNKMLLSLCEIIIAVYAMTILYHYSMLAFIPILYIAAGGFMIVLTLWDIWKQNIRWT